MLNVRITDYHVLGQGEIEYVKRISRYGARGVIFDNDNHVIMMHMKNCDLYKLPGGGIEPGETMEQAFIREIREETGYECNITGYLGTVEEHKSKNDFLHISHCFIANTRGPRGQVSLSYDERHYDFQVCACAIDKALELMEQSILSCSDYKRLFMLHRDKAILEYVIKVRVENE